MARSILQFVVDVFDLHSELNNGCSGLIGGMIYLSVVVAAIIVTVPRLLDVWL